MPTLALLVLELALGMATASLAATELRASTRAAVETEGFRALGIHAASVVFPAALFLLLRYPDWMVSYAFDGARLPSAVSLLLALLAVAAPPAGFALGARWVRAHDARRPLAVALGLSVTTLVLCLALRARVGHVGTWVQFRGGFGLQRLGASSLLPVLSLVALAQGGAWAWLVLRVLRRR
ncbi:MAG: hypothetical protein U0325_32440 [Polyangiales bacterium]